MSAKVPIYLKRGSRKGKKEKLRDLLSSDMISPPLGDFRHTIHIGSGGEGDMFGDISFLQGKFHLLPGTGGEGPDDDDDGAFNLPFQFARTATVYGREPLGFSDGHSPLLKNAISLPVIGGPQALTLPSAQAPPKPPRLHLEPPAPAAGESEDSAAWRTREPDSPRNGFVPERDGEEPFLSQASSLLSLHVDLGPSILDDVLQIMDQHQDPDRVETPT
ncbi:cdc42 effector protein 2-like [Monodelphis domestica]|uniref:CDC42 effector protein 2 n=1 Tax=Monodelphis domestica TaxID=13616 RepID=F7GG65_MONDO|nr:cdc42 effector protein 2 [Monodelphis domestica]XP_056657335.1 cdc42 effector protein 2-like [Monodelphis domestica]XP_056657336.1 cdc42 effector protein 2-like [Monodelphis domestica]